MVNASHRELALNESSDDEGTVSDSRRSYSEDGQTPRPAASRWSRNPFALAAVSVGILGIAAVIGIICWRPGAVENGQAFMGGSGSSGMTSSSDGEAGTVGSSVLQTGAWPATPPTPGPTTARRLECADVQSCGNLLNSCSDAEKTCYETVKTAMDAKTLAAYDIFPSFAWYPKQRRQDLRFEDYQYLIATYSGRCPLPCTAVRTPPVPPPSQAPAFQPPCPPNTNGAADDYRKPDPPKQPTDYNGMEWPELCFEGDDDEHVLLIGDWGGLYPGIPADHSKDKKIPGTDIDRQYVLGLDDRAQFLVADQFARRAKMVKPRYILNVGDNFYWGGCDEECANRSIAESIQVFNSKNLRDTNYTNYFKSHTKCADQFYSIFETMYMGEGLDNKPWFSVLGNHDYGGFHYHAAWDQQIAYTWGPSGRWVLPALYYSLHVRYPSKNFTVDYFFLDTNIGDVNENVWVDPKHNICGKEKNEGFSCAPFGPRSAEDCVDWFKNLWKEQMAWLDKRLAESKADWQIIVTHFPPEANVNWQQFVWDLKEVGTRGGVDVIIAGHRHLQGLYRHGWNGYCPTAGIPYVVTGGGGGITSDLQSGPGDQDHPAPDGKDQYGYMDMKLTKDEISIQGYNEAGEWRGDMKVWKRDPVREEEAKIK